MEEILRMTGIDFLAEAEALRSEVIARRRDFHQHPELAFQEFRTAGIVADVLTELGMEVQTGIAGTGVIGILEGATDGLTVLVRADMDALPIEEANQTEYVSLEAGKMHACGHDGHTAIALSVARLLSQHRHKIAGRVKFVFQPAEEVGQGARKMIDAGALESPRPDVSLGLHLWNTLPVGTVGIAEGPVMAAASDFTITITGRGGHGAMPEQTIDPVVCAAQMTMAFQTIVSRNTNPLDTAVVTVTQIHAGTTNNVIPDRAVVSGTFRMFRRETRELIDQRMRAIAQYTAAAMNCEVTIQINHFTDPVINDPAVAEKAIEAFRKVGKTETDFVVERTMGAEDVSEFMTDIPGTFFFVGCANPARGLDFPHHHPQFDFDEDALPQGIALLAAAVGEYVLKEA
jgi:amidohydrolase